MPRLCIDTPSIYELCLALHPSAREAATGTMKPRSGQLMPKNSKEETCGMQPIQMREDKQYIQDLVT